MNLMQWFKLLSMEGKIGVVGSIASILGIIFYFFGEEPIGQMSTKGNNSPIITETKGNVNYTTNQLLKYGDENLSKKINDKIPIIFNNSKLFSKVIEALLDDLKFLDIKSQFKMNNKPSFLAYRLSEVDNSSESWSFEVRSDLMKNNILPDLTSYEISPSKKRKFVIFSKTTIPEEISKFLNKTNLANTTYIVPPNLLAELIEKSPKALSELSINSENNNLLDINDLVEYKFSIGAPIRFNFVIEVEPTSKPYKYSYILMDSKVTKAHHDAESGFLLTIFNDSEYPFDINTVSVVTDSYTDSFNRVLTLSKAKGVIKPIELRFNPSSQNNSESNKINPAIIRVEKNKPEIIVLKSDKHSKSGLYELHFKLAGNINGKNITRNTPRFFLYIQDKNISGNEKNLLTLQTYGYHPDDGAKVILDLNKKNWNFLVERVNKMDKRIVLGPDLWEYAHKEFDEFWTVRETMLRKPNHIDFQDLLSIEKGKIILKTKERIIDPYYYHNYLKQSGLI